MTAQTTRDIETMVQKPDQPGGRFVATAAGSPEQVSAHAGSDRTDLASLPIYGNSTLP
jgi:hypothetical protein